MKPLTSSKTLIRKNPNVNLEHTVVDPLTQALNLNDASTSDVESSITPTTVGVLSSNNAPTYVRYNSGSLPITIH